MRHRPAIFPLSRSQEISTQTKAVLRDSTEGKVKCYIKVKHRLDSALLRQAIYATLRLGIYFNLTDHIKLNVNNGSNLSAW